jgi:nucleotide-binding universal stress UspA family protein
MSLFASILVPLDGSRTAARGIGCAAWLASRLDARLHIVSATPREAPAREELANLQIPEEHWPRIVLHQPAAHPEGAILSALARHQVGLVVMTARGKAGEAPDSAGTDPGKIVGHVTRAVIERSGVPVLLLPPNYREVLPWERVLVPVSGEAEADEALALAVRLACSLDLEVQVAHVADPEGSDEGLAARVRYADALHHEYAGRLEGLITRGLAQCRPEESGRVKAVALCRGDVAAELQKLIEDKAASLVAVGWRGRFMAGRARVLKQLIQAIAAPVLLVQPAAPMLFRLNVGEEME